MDSNGTTAVSENSTTSTTTTIADVLEGPMFIAYLATFVIGVVEFLVIIVLGFHLFFKSDSKLKSGFFVLIFCGSLMDVIFVLFNSLQESTQYDVLFIRNFGDLVQWYSLLFFGCVNTLIALNRFCALVYFHLYDKLWSGKFLAGYVLLLVLYPFIVNGYSYFDFNCRWNAHSEPCTPYLVANQTFISVANSTHAVISLTLGIFTFFYVRRQRRTSKMSKRSAIESRLLLNSLLSSSLLILVSLIQLWSTFNISNSAVFHLLKYISGIFYAIYHYPGLFSLFFLSKAFRSEILKFYGFHHVFYLGDSTTVLVKVHGASKAS